MSTDAFFYSVVAMMVTFVLVCSIVAFFIWFEGLDNLSAMPRTTATPEKRFHQWRLARRPQSKSNVVYLQPLTNGKDGQ